MRHAPPHIMAAVVCCVVVVTTGVVAAADEPADDAPTDMDGLTEGDAPWQLDFDEAMLDGRQAYNEEQWTAAIDHFRRAVQMLPEQPAAYRNLARAYNLDGQLHRATAYYDAYLELAPDADDADDIRNERRGAVARGGDESWTTPADQRMARRALERELDDGRALTDGGGGAWAMYQTLLELGYARPDLRELRQQLDAKLVDEFEDLLTADEGLVPVVDRRDWSLQDERLIAIGTTTRSDDRLDWLERRRLLVDAATALLDGDYSDAATAAGDAAEANDDLAYIGWYRVVALDADDRPDDALQALEPLVDGADFDDDARRQIDVLYARLLQRLGRSDDAAELFEELLLR